MERENAAKSEINFINILFFLLFEKPGLKEKTKRHHLETSYAPRRRRMRQRAKCPTNGRKIGRYAPRFVQDFAARRIDFFYDL